MNNFENVFTKHSKLVSLLSLFRYRDVNKNEDLGSRINLEPIRIADQEKLFEFEIQWDRTLDDMSLGLGPLSQLFYRARVSH